MGLEVLALGSTLASAGIGAAGAGMTGAANSARAAYQAQVARNNAKIAGWNADAAIVSSQFNAMRTGMKNAEQQGQIAAIQGASGLQMNDGSLSAVRDSAQIIGRLDETTQAWQGDVRATDFRNQQQSYLAEAFLRDADAQNAKIAGSFGVANSLIGGAGQFATKWGRFSLYGVE